MSTMTRRTWTMASGCVALLAVAGAAPTRAQNVTPVYPRMAAVDRYLMDREAEMALARSGAPAAISRDATVLVLGRHGYETGAQGSNGFTCMVERGWVGMLDWPERWNPKIRGADCLNPPATRSVLPLAEIRTEMVLAGRPMPEIVAALKTALANGAVPALESGAMGYMMAKGSYLTDQGGHNMPHVMLFVPLAEARAWAAGTAGSPVGSAPYWFSEEGNSSGHEGLPPIRVLTIGVGKWSDGTPAVMHGM